MTGATLKCKQFSCDLADEKVKNWGPQNVPPSLTKFETLEGAIKERCQGCTCPTGWSWGFWRSRPTQQHPEHGSRVVRRPPSRAGGGCRCFLAESSKRRWCPLRFPRPPPWQALWWKTKRQLVIRTKSFICQIHFYFFFQNSAHIFWTLSRWLNTSSRQADHFNLNLNSFVSSPELLDIAKGTTGLLSPK